MNISECIDIGSEYCPCHLAELGECIACSLLQGKQACGCNWSGSCVYMEYQWQKEKAKNKRPTVKALIIDRRNIQADLFLLKLDVGHKLAQNLCYAGSFVFLRGNYESPFFDAPIAVINSNAEKGTIVVAVAIRGPKTKLISESKEWLFVRGPYWNGIYGYRFIEQTKHSSCLIVLNGVSQASGVLVANQMINNTNKVFILINSADIVFIKNYLNEPIKIYKEDFFGERWMKLIKEMIKINKISCVYSGGHKKQHELIKKLIIETGEYVNLTTSNNNILTCGEGICGSCTQNNDRPLRRCKTQNDKLNI